MLLLLLLLLLLLVLLLLLLTLLLLLSLLLLSLLLLFSSPGCLFCVPFCVGPPPVFLGCFRSTDEHYLLAIWMLLKRQFCPLP